MCQIWAQFLEPGSEIKRDGEKELERDEVRHNRFHFLKQHLTRIPMGRRERKTKNLDESQSFVVFNFSRLSL